MASELCLGPPLARSPGSLSPWALKSSIRQVASPTARKQRLIARQLPGPSQYPVTRFVRLTAAAQQAANYATPPSGRGNVDLELWEVLDLATEAELVALHNIMYGAYAVDFPVTFTAGALLQSTGPSLTTP